MRPRNPLRNLKWPDPAAFETDNLRPSDCPSSCSSPTEHNQTRQMGSLARTFSLVTIHQKDNGKSVLKKDTPLINALLGRVAKATRAFGAKAELARFLGVKPPQLSAWLSGKKEPGGEATLALLKWVAAAEAKTKRRASVTTTDAPEIRPQKPSK